MTNPHEHDVENVRVRIRCSDCRTTFHERLNRVIHGDRVTCPTCHEDMYFHGIGHIRDHDSIEAYVRHVEEYTCRPHFSLGR
jgi:Zn finger protein HypA/HybF involved in hydrogenase expression